jgi:hypothetical protein
MKRKSHKICMTQKTVNDLHSLISEAEEKGLISVKKADKLRDAFGSGPRSA